MPVSPQDFALWSHYTGNPYPQTPAERMALAPQVYEFNRNIGRQGGPTMSPARRAVDVVGKAALAAGALASAAYLGSKYLTGEEGLSGFPASFGKLGLDDEPAVPPTGPMGGGGGPASQVAQTTGDITPPTTSDRFGQDIVTNQTAEVQQLKGLSSAKPTTSPIEAKPATQSEVISSQQHFSPGTEAEMLGQGAAERAAAFRKSKAYALMQQRYPTLRAPGEELVGGGEVEMPAPTPKAVMISEEVLPSRTVRVTKPVPTVEESAVVEMARPVTVSRPVAAPVTVGGGGPSAEEIREIDTSLARGLARHTPEQRAEIRNQMLAKKYGEMKAPAEVETIVTPTQPTPVRVASEELSSAKAGLFEKAAQRKGRTKFPPATTPGTEEHLIAQAIEHLEGRKAVPAGAMSQDLSGSTIKNITVYPENQVSVTYTSDPETSYAFKSDPRYTSELKSIMGSGQFGKGGMHSAGGFIQAGINKGLLY